MHWFFINAIIRMQLRMQQRLKRRSFHKQNHINNAMRMHSFNIFHPLLFIILLAIGDRTDCSDRRKNDKARGGKNLNAFPIKHRHRSYSFVRNAANTYKNIYQCTYIAYICRLPYIAALCGANGREYHRRQPWIFRTEIRGIMCFRCFRPFHTRMAQ